MLMLISPTKNLRSAWLSGDNKGYNRKDVRTFTKTVETSRKCQWHSRNEPCYICILLSKIIRQIRDQMKNPRMRNSERCSVEQNDVLNLAHLVL
jgi:hypothetical protein